MLNNKLHKLKLIKFKSSISNLNHNKKSFEAESEKLTAESEKHSAEIDELSKNIVARNESLANQARSAQTSGTVTSILIRLITQTPITGSNFTCDSYE